MGSSCAASCTSVWGTRRRSAAPAPLPRGCAPPPAPTSTTCARSEAARRNATNRGGRGDAAVGADRVRADPHAPHRRVPASRRDHRPTGGVGRVAGNIKRPSSEPRQTIFYKLRDTSPMIETRDSNESPSRRPMPRSVEFVHRSRRNRARHAQRGFPPRCARCQPRPLAHEVAVRGPRLAAVCRLHDAVPVSFQLVVGV